MKPYLSTSVSWGPALVVSLAGVAGLGSLAAAEDAKQPSAEGVEFFEKKVRPLLVKNCYECHSTKKQQGGLRLDSREGWAKGGDSGPAIVPGDPEKSLLIEAVRYAGNEMPPSGKLPADQIATLERWVKIGAPDPRLAAPVDVTVKATNTLEAGRTFWVYQPPKRNAPPAVKQSKWPHSEIDVHVLARLEAEGLKPVADADRSTLLRRLYFDLIGLPPTPEQIDAFVNDTRTDAYERVVDELLASPRFGERWGRHWLDVARYGESVTLRGFVFPDAWRYRDYVIDAFNRDLPYNRFVQEQIAGDLLPADSLAERGRQLTATTFLMLGNTNFEEQDKKQLDMDVVDEQLDTLGKAFLAQTIGCARCHDHKFDPIPTRDYYALAGILRSATAMEHSNVSKWTEMPLPLAPEEERQFKEHESAVAALQAEIKTAKARVTALADAKTKPTTESPAILATADLPGIVLDSASAKAVGEWQHSTFSKRYVGDGYLHDKNAEKGTKTLTFQSERLPPGRYEVRLAYSAGTTRATNVPVTILHADGETEVEVDQQQAPPIDDRFVSLGKFRFEQNQGFVLVSNEGTKGHVTADAVQFLPIEAAATTNGPGKNGGAVDPKTATAKNGAKNEAAAKDDPQASAAAQDVKRLEQQLKKLTDDGPKRPKVMALREEGKFRDVPIHIRGSVHNLGAMAPRGFLQVATLGKPAEIPTDESGRRQLADWIASADNPLTARVMANRIWHWLFGVGLVRTTDNFGVTGETPSHPELLDHLAVRFVEQGWSVKRLVRDIVTSHSYRLASTDDKQSRAEDPENLLLWRMNRRRLDAEAIRDAMLQASGQLRHIDGGPTYKPGISADYGYQYSEPTRSVYVPIFRNSLPDLFEAFDFPEPSMVTGRRNTSTVAPQALFLMNHPFAIEQSAAAAKRLLAEPLPDDAARVAWLYRTALGRSPTDKERQIALECVADSGTESKAKDPAAASARRWSTLFQAVFASPDFRYVE